MATINMSKMQTNQKINMCKEDGSTIKKVLIAIGWEVNRYAGEAEADLDIHGMLTDSSRKVQYPENIINYNTYNDGSKYPWIEFSGDNRTGDDSKGIDFNGKHYDEFFIIDTSNFPSNRTELTICITIYRAVQRLQNFNIISNAKLIVCDYDNPEEFCREYDLSEEERFAKLNAVEVGKLYRYNGGFKFQATCSGYTGGMTELFKNFGLDIDEGRD